MSDHEQSPNFGLLLLAGIGAGALTGILIGLMAARRPRAQAQTEMVETVEDLKRRAEQILNDLAAASATPPN